MKILFISSGLMPDYQCDSLFHGLRSLYGNSVIDINKIKYLYQSFPEVEKAKLYGRGFSLYGLLEDDFSIDRNDIENKIKNQFFDLIIYGSIHRCQLYLNLVLEFYPPSKIAFIDGEDHQEIITLLLNRGIYFKRELTTENRFIYPLHFGIPQEKFIEDIEALEKINFWSPCDPRDRSTYIYDTEDAYYEQYQASFFGFTQKKSGWDCLRHYEIIAQGCAPYFENLTDCPYLTMHRFPRLETWQLMQIADQYLDHELLDLEGYLLNIQALFNYAKKNLTTEAVAKYLILTIKQT